MSTPAPEFPAIRNNWTRVAMRRIRTFPDERRRGLLDAIPRETQTAIAHGRPDEWLPAEHAIIVCDTIQQQLGVEQSVEFWRTIVFDSYAGGLLEALIVGLNEDSDLLGLAPAAWDLSASNCGHIAVVPSRTGLRLEARELPPGMRESLGIQAMFAGAVRAILAFSKLEAQIEFDADLPEGAIGFELQLGPRG
jgi:hypothetical protein